MRKISLVLLISILLISTIAYAGPCDPYRHGYIEGYLKEINNQNVTIEEYDGTFHTIRFMKNAILKIDGIPVSPLEFRPGMEVYGELRGRTIKFLESYSTENPGYIPPGKKVRAGVVKNIRPDSVTIKFSIGGEGTYIVTPTTLVSRKGEIIPFDRIYEGDRVRLFFDEYNTKLANRIALEGDSILVKGLYKGTISYSNNLDDKIVLENMKVFRNTSWKDYSPLISLSCDQELPIYIGGQKINNNNLKYYKGQEVYVAVKDFFGQDKIEKMVVKSNGERAYAEKIIDVNYYSDSFELKNYQNFKLNDGTIIVKNDRLVDKYSVNPQSDVYVVSEGYTNPQANILYILNEDMNNSNIGQSYLYFGRLDEIIDYSVLLRNYSILDRNTWDNSNRRRITTLYYDDDTHIYDMEEKKEITTKEFQAGNYAVDEDSSYAREKGLKDWYGYLYTNGDKILTLGLQKDKADLLKQRVTLGTIRDISKDPYVGDIIYLQDSRDWSNRKERFISKSTPLRLLIEEAIIVKDDKLISKEELRPNDRLYIIRDDFRCKFILVK